MRLCLLLLCATTASGCLLTDLRCNGAADGAPTAACDAGLCRLTPGNEGEGGGDGVNAQTPPATGRLSTCSPAAAVQVVRLE